MNREELEQKIKTLIKEKVRPILIMDGGNIEFISLNDDNIVEVELQGACHGCPMSAITLKNLVEDMLKENIPEIKGVINREPQEEDEELEF